MSDTKNHQKAIKAIIEAHRTPGKMREIMLKILADKPSAIVNAWEEIKPVKIVMEIAPLFPDHTQPDPSSKRVTCGGCYCVFMASDRVTACPECGHKPKQSESL